MHEAEVAYVAGHTCLGGTRVGLPYSTEIGRSVMYCAGPQGTEKIMLKAPMQDIPREHNFFSHLNNKSFLSHRMTLICILLKNELLCLLFSVYSRSIFYI